MPGAFGRCEFTPTTCECAPATCEFTLATHLMVPGYPVGCPFGLPGTPSHPPVAVGWVHNVGGEACRRKVLTSDTRALGCI
eukprot:907180-Prorocentrum_minimum.AAC.1